ncbi:glycogen synthase [Candidatus Sulfurimonas marisnigri]|uniref:Glycogen synthase n=1 Tax=Candidatus Sulfurimonas marisnigri TaxID=2740405 RepID=A0A7S7M0Q0_9BACT|nr:glycogen synthase [Candidatus Sulfurimonas marisnigri]QOY54850.1 glycogen synthase [Candidatus Sulfurimonas marisnigri]
MKILFAASEIFPFAKTGGLADVAQALPHSLSKHVDIVCVMPLYDFMDKSLLQKSELSFSVILGDITHLITLYTSNYKGVTTYFIQTPMLSDSQELYSSSSGSYANNNPNFGIFCAAIVLLAKELHVDIVHLNDWHTALAALWIKESAPQIKTVFTIHNLAYQGLFDASMLKYFGIDTKYFTMQGIEFHNQLSFIKAGIAYSDIVTTVSPQYAKEIMSERFGCGLHTFLHTHKEKIFGIINGIDLELFNPQTDTALRATFSSTNINSKYLNKNALLKELSLEISQKPLFVMVSRLAEQKGFDLLIDSIEQILKKNLILVIQVDGENSYKQKLVSIAKRFKNLFLQFGYNEDKSHRLYAAGDFLLMPSLYEPCGLSQMIAMRYGAVPVVHGVGGLLDTVHENQQKCGEGIVFSHPTEDALLDAVDRALKLGNNTKEMKRVIGFNMECDFSFDKSALSYIHHYKELVA